MKEHLENLDKARKEFEQQGRPPALLEAFLNGDQNRLLNRLWCPRHLRASERGKLGGAMSNLRYLEEFKIQSLQTIGCLDSL